MRRGSTPRWPNHPGLTGSAGAPPAPLSLEAPPPGETTPAPLASADRRGGCAALAPVAPNRSPAAPAVV
jgi:hypothetical protein